MLNPGMRPRFAAIVMIVWIPKGRWCVVFLGARLAAVVKSRVGEARGNPRSGLGPQRLQE